MARKQRSKGTGSLFKRTPGGPWIATYHDLTGKRREHSCRTTDYAAANRILTKLVADVALRRDRVIDPRLDRFSLEGRKPLAEHVSDYIASCRHGGQAERHVDQKQTHLTALLKAAGATRLADLNSDVLERHLGKLKSAGLSARSMNFARQIAVAFYSWCVRTGRAESNPLKVVAKQDESRDRRRVRRPLTDEELSSLLAVARARGRDAWYLAAVLAGLRKGDLQRLTWSDVDFQNSTLTVRHGKAKRVDVLPMHPQLADALRRRQDACPALPTARVFPDTVGDLTRLKDFLRAGLARRVTVLDSQGHPVMVGEGKHARPKTAIVTEDALGRVIDLHAMRTTMGTKLARAGVAPQLCQKLMRHSDYKTTLRHYTVLGLTDTSKAIGQLAAIVTASEDPQLFPQQLVRRSLPSGSSDCGPDDRTPEVIDGHKSSGDAELCEAVQGGTIPVENSRGRNSVVECQPSKLNVEGSNPFARFL
jgi:integrase